eukprot:2493321-Prymnesium_polylepis.1
MSVHSGADIDHPSCFGGADFFQLENAPNSTVCPTRDQSGKKPRKLAKLLRRTDLLRPLAALISCTLSACYRTPWH